MITLLIVLGVTLAVLLFMQYSKQQYKKVVHNHLRPKRWLPPLFGGMILGEIDWRRLVYDTSPLPARMRLSESWSNTAGFSSDWQPMTPGAYIEDADNPLIRQDAVKASRYYSEHAALYGRAIRLHTNYIFGRGVGVYALDNDNTDTGLTVQDIIDQFQADVDNKLITRAEGQRKLCRKFFTDGELFLAYFVNKGTGAVKVRLVDPLEITHIITSENDKEKPEYYERNYQQYSWDWNAQAYNSIQNKILYYPDWQAKELDAGFEPVSLINISNHDATGTLHSNAGDGVYMSYYRNDNEGYRGLPPFYAALRDVKIREGRVLDWARLLVAAATFAFKMKTNGNRTQLDAIADQWLNYTAGQSSRAGSFFETAEGAQTIFENEKTELSQFNFTLPSGEWDTALMTLAFQISAGTDITYANLTGDARNGNLASMNAMDGPQQKGFEAWQKFFEDMLKDIYNFVIKCAVKYNDNFSATNPDGTQKDMSIIVKMPPIVTRDLPSVINAISQLVSAQAMLGKELYPRDRMTQQIAKVFGDDDINAVLDEINDVNNLPDVDFANGLPDTAADALEALKEKVELALYEE